MVLKKKKIQPKSFKQNVRTRIIHRETMVVAVIATTDKIPCMTYEIYMIRQDIWKIPIPVTSPNNSVR